MTTLTIPRDGEKNLRFEGELLGEVSSCDNNAHPDYSGSAGRWSELKLYKTDGGKFICQRVGHTRWEDEVTRYDAAVCENETEVQDYFGFGWLSKELYEQVGIEPVDVVE